MIAESARVIRNGGVVVFPTRHLYGLAADAFNPQAVQRVFDIKRRPPEKPLLLLINQREDMRMLADDIPPAAVCLMDAFWPGKITIVLPAGPLIDETLTGGTGKIGIRVPAHPVATALVKAVGRPVTGTSANISGTPGCSTVSELDPRVAEDADLILDAGPLTPGTGSTVVDARPEGVTILREGTISRCAIESALRQSGFPHNI